MEAAKRSSVIAGASVLAVAAGGVGVAVATGGDDNKAEAPIQGNALDRPAPRRSTTRPGQVTETETGDEESYYEVEVTPDGSQVDVQLNRASTGGGSADSETQSRGRRGRRRLSRRPHAGRRRRGAGTPLR